jgi:hypothetical protein
MQVCDFPQGRYGNAIFRYLASSLFCILYGAERIYDKTMCDNVFSDYDFIQWSNCVLDGDIPIMDLSKKYLFRGYYQHDAIFLKYKSQLIDYICLHKDDLLITDGYKPGGTGIYHYTVAQYRVPNQGFLQECINRLYKRYTVLHFGLSNRMTSFDNVIEIKDLEITKLAACYSIIGKYFGIDTGDYWLTIATGGEAEVICPDSTPFYNHEEWHLKPEMWWTEPIRIRYTDFNLNSRYQNQIDSFLF